MYRRRFALAAIVGAFVACAPDIARDPPATGIRPVFSSDTGQLPLPSDLLKNSTTGKLDLPLTATDSPLTVEVKASINRLDGWLTAQTVTLPFEVRLDTSTLTYENVLLYDVTRASEDPPVVTRLTKEDFYILFNVGRTAATSPPFNVILKRKPLGAGKLPAEFTPGGRYAAIVTDAVRDIENRSFLDNPIFYFLRARTPLAINGKSTTILTDAQATQLEATRVIYDAAFSAIEATGGINRDRALSFTVFSIESGARAVMNPTLVDQVLPMPFDNPTSANAPIDTTPTITFDQPLNASTAASGTHLYKVDGATLTEVAETPAVAANADANGRYFLKIVPNVPLDRGASYIAVLTDAIKGANGVSTEAFSYFSLVRNKNPLLDTTKSPAALNSPFLDNTLDVLIFLGGNPASPPGEPWESAYNLLVPNIQSLDDLRLRYAPYFTVLETDRKIERLSITALWQFTTEK
jgi:hypothetical protein